MNDWSNTDAVCCAISPKRSRQSIRITLNQFIPEFEPLNLAYAIRPEDPTRPFHSEDEMIDYFVYNKDRDQTFFWNQRHNNTNGIMVGAYFTNDNGLIMSLTVSANGRTEFELCDQLKSLLSSPASTVSYNQIPAFENAVDFMRKYSK